MKPPRRKRAWLLPLAAAGLAVVLPWRAFELFQGWQAYASENTTQVATAALPPPPPAAVAPSAAAKPSAPPAPSCDGPLALVSSAEQTADANLLAEVARRNVELDKREHALQLRAAQIEAASKLAQAQMAQLEQLRDSMQTLVVHETSASAADMQLLVGLYSNMRPTQAAVVLSKLAPERAAEILQHLPTRTAGPILAAMDATAAVKVTQELQQRHAAFVQ